MGLFDRVRSGQRLRLSAGDHNAHQEAALKARIGPPQRAEIPSPEGFPTTICKIRNDTGEDLAQGEVVGLGTALITPDDCLPEFKRQLKFIGEVPLEGVHEGYWAVLLESAKGEGEESERDGAIVSAVVAGCVYALVRVPWDDPEPTAVEIESSSQLLHPNASGSAQVLWIEPQRELTEEEEEEEEEPEYDDRWAYIRIGGTGGGVSISGAFDPITADCFSACASDPSGYAGITNLAFDDCNFQLSRPGTPNNTVVIKTYGATFNLIVLNEDCCCVEICVNNGLIIGKCLVQYCPTTACAGDEGCTDERFTSGDGGGEE